MFDNFPNGFVNVTAKQRMLLVAPTMWPYYLSGVVGLVMLGLRRFRLFLILVLGVVLGGQVSSFAFPRSGVVEIAAADFKPETIRSIDAASRVAKADSDPQQARAVEVYHYTLAQLAYLAGDPAPTARKMGAVGALDSGPIHPWNGVLRSCALHRFSSCWVRPPSSLRWSICGKGAG